MQQCKQSSCVVHRDNNTVTYAYQCERSSPLFAFINFWLRKSLSLAQNCRVHRRSSAAADHFLRGSLHQNATKLFIHRPSLCDGTTSIENMQFFADCVLCCFFTPHLVRCVWLVATGGAASLAQCEFSKIQKLVLTLGQLFVAHTKHGRKR